MARIRVLIADDDTASSQDVDEAIAEALCAASIIPLLSAVTLDSLSEMTDDERQWLRELEDPDFVPDETNVTWRIVLEGEKGIDGETLYWSNDDGWVGVESATVFTNKERYGYPDIPKGGEWEQAKPLTDDEILIELVSQFIREDDRREDTHNIVKSIREHIVYKLKKPDPLGVLT